MVRTNPLQVFIIDFGRSNCTFADQYRAVDKEYKFKFTPTIDLLILLTHMMQKKYMCLILKDFLKTTILIPFWRKVLRNNASTLTPDMQRIAEFIQEEQPYWWWHSLVGIDPMYSETLSEITPVAIRDAVSKL